MYNFVNIIHFHIEYSKELTKNYKGQYLKNVMR